MTDMLNGTEKETELLRQLHGYAKAQYDDDRILSQVLHDAAAMIVTKNEEIAGLRDQLAFGRERTIDEKLDKLALKFAVAVAFEGIVLDPEKTERLREQIKKDAAEVYYLCAQPLYDKIAALAAKNKEITRLTAKFNLQVEPELRAAEVRGMRKAADMTEKLFTNYLLASKIKTQIALHIRARAKRLEGLTALAEGDSDGSGKAKS